MTWFQDNFGEIAALLTAVFWTATALAFESASMRVGSLAVNVIRLFIGLFFLSVYTAIFRGHVFPSDASSFQWFWLSVSGFIGFVLGDLFLFKSYTIIGSRFSMLIMTLVPPIAAFEGWLILGERMSFYSLTGMLLTFSGIFIAIFSRENKKGNFQMKLAPKGVLLAFGGAVGQATGLVLSKYGMQDYDPFAATQIRIITGIFGFVILVTVLKRWQRIYHALFHLKAMVGITTGSFFGPFLGVSFSLLAVKYTETGIASTIMAIVPVLIIPPAVWFFKQKVTTLEVVGAILSVMGVAMFFIV